MPRLRARSHRTPTTHPRTHAPTPLPSPPRSDDVSQADFQRRREYERARQFDPPATVKGGTKVSEECRAFLKRCLTYRHEDRPDVIEAANDEWIKGMRRGKAKGGAGGEGA